MKQKYQYKVSGKVVEKEYSYIPVRYIISMLILLQKALKSHRIC